MYKRLKSFCFVIIMFLMCSDQVMAQEKLAIDGSFTDWSNISHISLSNTSSLFSQCALAYDEEYVYVHVIEKSSNKWETNYPSITLSCNGTTKEFLVVRNDFSGKDGIFNLSIKNSWYNDISNTQAKVLRQKGINEWELKIPIYDILISNANENSNNVKAIQVDSLNVAWTNGGAVSIDGVYIGTQIIPTPTSPPGENPNTAGIVIDGYYDDWESMPITDIGYNGGHMNEASLVKDGSYIYLYYKMNYKFDWLPLDSINLNVAGKSTQLFVRYPKDDGSVNWSKDVYNLRPGIYNNLASFISGYDYMLGAAAVTIAKNNCLELKVSIEKLEKALGLNPGTINNGAPISVRLPNLGNETIHAQGVSTGTVIGILFSGLAAVFLWKFDKKRKKTIVEMKLLDGSQV